MDLPRRRDGLPARLPERCENGHELKPGTVHFSWRPCSCLGRGEPGKPGGHEAAWCNACRWNMIDPEHQG